MRPLKFFPTLESATLIEADPTWHQIGSRLGAGSDSPAIRNAHRVEANLKSFPAFDAHDLVIISYALGELPDSAASKTLADAWQAARRFLVVVEPGTRRGFAVINRTRSRLIAAGAPLLAPCPHEKVCPMAAAGDWCHFAQRVERTPQHRALKGGNLGYEDEKFSYVLASRGGQPLIDPRIVRHPLKLSGHVKLTLCTPDGLEHRTITRSQKEQYRLARKAEWGDSWNL